MDKPVAFYLLYLGVLFIILTLRVVKLRGSQKTLLGDNHNDYLKRAIRAQGNFAETVPMILIMVGFAIYWQVSALVVQAILLCLSIGRTIHALNISRLNERLHWRVLGMGLTVLSLVGTLVAIACQMFSS